MGLLFVVSKASKLHFRCSWDPERLTVLGNLEGAWRFAQTINSSFRDSRVSYPPLRDSGAATNY